MKENKQEIATNVSSGAEKVERVEKETKATSGNGENKTTTQKTVKKSTAAKPKAQGQKKTVKTERKIDVKKMNAESTNGKAEKESEAAKARVQAALKKKEEKAKREAERKAAKEKKAAARKARMEKRAAARKALMEKRAAEKKERAEKHAAERKALAEKRAAEKEAKIRERAHGKATRSQEKQRAKKRAQERKEKRDSQRKERNGERKKGYGGWLAAVISLGAVTLALTTALTVGAIDMKRTKEAAMSGYRATTYELIGIMENVDDDLDRARISASPAQQSRILTDLLVQARLAELDLEKMPISAEADRNVTSFINRVGAECERMLAKLRRGGTLSKEDQASLQRLYETNHEVRMMLDEYAMKMTDKDIAEYIKEGAGGFAGLLDKLEKATLPENNPLDDTKNANTTGAGMERSHSMPAMGEENGKKIDPSQAEDFCARYFSDYNVKEFQCIGETVARGYGAYNVQGYDDRGTLLFAEVDYRDGRLLRFDYYEPCEGEKFDIDNSRMLAEEFLDKLGYDDMLAVRARENGTDVDFTFVYEDDGIAYYPDRVQVKVCRARGVVTGMDATRYVMHHKDREDVDVKLTISQAQAKLHEGLAVESSRLAVVSTPKGERAAYEFVCGYDGERYVVYVDASSGDELAIVNVKNLG